VVTVETVMTLRNEGIDLTELSDEQLFESRNYYNVLLETAFFSHSGKYDNIAAVVKEIEEEITRREHEGPPWLVD
jgi:hypothetical protein